MTLKNNKNIHHHKLSFSFSHLRRVQEFRSNSLPFSACRESSLSQAHSLSATKRVDVNSNQYTVNEGKILPKKKKKERKKGLMK